MVFKYRSWIFEDSGFVVGEPSEDGTAFDCCDTDGFDEERNAEKKEDEFEFVVAARVEVGVDVFAKRREPVSSCSR